MIKLGDLVKEITINNPVNFYDFISKNIGIIFKTIGSKNEISLKTGIKNFNNLYFEKGHTIEEIMNIWNMNIDISPQDKNLYSVLVAQTEEMKNNCNGISIIYNVDPWNKIEIGLDYSKLPIKFNGKNLYYEFMEC